MMETSIKVSDFSRSLSLLKVNHMILYINYTSIKKTSSGEKKKIMIPGEG